MAAIKIDEKILVQLRAANMTANAASRAVTRARAFVANAEAKADEAERAFEQLAREAVLRAGLDPDRPLKLDLNTGEVEQEPAK